jgi:hypothetical protein
VCPQFSPILILLFKYSKKFGGVRKFLLENPSYKFVYALIFFSHPSLSNQKQPAKEAFPFISTSSMALHVEYFSHSFLFLSQFFYQIVFSSKLSLSFQFNNAQFNLEKSGIIQFGLLFEFFPV